MLRTIDLPDCQFNGEIARQSQPLTRRNLEHVMAYMKLGARFNVMTHAVVLTREGVDLSPDEQDAAYIALGDQLKLLDIKQHLGIDAMLTAIGRGDMFHPVEDRLRSVEWDGVDRLSVVEQSISTPTALWPVYLENWLVQVVEGVCGWRRQVPRPLGYCLVLVGGQGLGKTEWLRRLGSGMILNEAELHLGTVAGKDHQIQALKWPIVELSELDGIFRKNDVSQLKSFLTRGWDELREPYARRAIGRPRMTTFCGSVNWAAFLNDPSGSRRFWPVQVERVDWGLDVDWAQFWAQAYAMWCDDPFFGLTSEEEALRAQGAADFTLASPEADLVAAHWSQCWEEWDSYAVLNVTEIAQLVGFQRPSMGTAAAVRGWLESHLGPARKLRGKYRSWAFPVGKSRLHAEILNVQPCNILKESEAKKLHLARAKRVAL